MVLLKLRCPPEKRKALVTAHLTTSSPTLSLSAPEDPESPFKLVINLRIAESTQPGRAITICSNGTCFQSAKPGEGLDMLCQNAFSGLVSTSDPSRKISLGNLKPHRARSGTTSANLKEREWVQLLTIPAEGPVQITHDMPMSRIFKYEDRLSKDDLRPGESYKLRMNPDYFGSMWWCWGDLDGDLKGKKLSAWQEGINFDRAEKPTPDEVEKEGWVLGENPAELTFEDRGGYTEFQLVE